VCFIRGDRAGAGESLATQVVASYNYWNVDSGKYFDIIFPGWEINDGWSSQHSTIEPFTTPRFDIKCFLESREMLESLTKWRYSNETDLLIVNFDYHLKRRLPYGDFAFDEVIYLPVEEMIRDGRISNLDKLFGDLIAKAKETWPRSNRSSVWTISDKYALEKGRKAVWDIIKEKFLIKDLATIYKELRPYAVCDLRVEG
jgi:hypothetical protein